MGLKTEKMETMTPNKKTRHEESRETTVRGRAKKGPFM